MEIDLDDADIVDSAEHGHLITSTSDLLSQINPVSTLGRSKRTESNYFDVAAQLRDGKYPRAPLPFRTFTDPIAGTAFQLNRNASFRMMAVDDAAELYKIADLRPALADFLTRIRSGVTDHTIVGRRISALGAHLPFDTLQIWSSLRIQSRSYHKPHAPLPPHTITASPPSDKTAWTFGCYDPVILNIDSSSQWPKCGLTGHLVVQVCLIFRAVPRRGYNPVPGTDQFLSYVRRFEVVSQVNPRLSGSPTIKGPYPDPVSSLYIVKRSRRSDGAPMGDIVPLHQIRAAVELTPCHGVKANQQLTKESSLHHHQQFYLDKYFEKELFYALDI